MLTALNGGGMDLLMVKRRYPTMNSFFFLDDPTLHYHYLFHNAT